MEDIDDDYNIPITPNSPHRHISEISFTTVDNEYGKLLTTLNNSSQIQNPDDTYCLNAVYMKDKTKLESRLFWLQLSKDLCKINDMQNVFLYLQWSKLEPKRNHNVLKLYFRLWKRNIQVHRWEFLINGLLAQKQIQNLDQAFKQVINDRIKFASDKFSDEIEKGEIISNHIDISNKYSDHQQSKELIIDPIRALGEQAVPTKELEMLANLKMKPEKPTPRYLLSPRRFNSPSPNIKSLMNSESFSPTSIKNKKRRARKLNLNESQSLDDSEIKIREINFSMKEEEIDENEKLNLQKLETIQDFAVKKNGIPFYLYLLVFLLFLGIGFAMFIIITPNRNVQKIEDGKAT